MYFHDVFIRYGNDLQPAFLKPRVLGYRIPETFLENSGPFRTRLPFLDYFKKIAFLGSQRPDIEERYMCCCTTRRFKCIKCFYLFPSSTSSSLLADTVSITRPSSSTGIFLVLYNIYIYCKNKDKGKH